MMAFLVVLTLNAQKCAVLEFRGARSVSVTEIDGISEMFMTYFRPAGYTMVERGQIDKVISEQGFQRSNLTDEQMVRLGKILNASKVVVGTVSLLGGKYQVDVRVVDVELGNDIAFEGAAFSGDYRTNVRNLAAALANKIAISYGCDMEQTTLTTPEAPVAPRKRTSVEVLYGYLKIFPNELGVFQAEPASVISQINAQAQYGYNNWRIPTEEELSLMRANNYLGVGDYMSRENGHGIVLLVSDGKDYQTVQTEELARIKVEQDYKAALRAQGWVDLGLSSGTLWKDKNEEGGPMKGYYSYTQAINRFGRNLPSREQFEELKSECQWIWIDNGYQVIGPNGNSIVLPTTGRLVFSYVDAIEVGFYWSSTIVDFHETWSWGFVLSLGGIVLDDLNHDSGYSVRLVQK